MIHPKFFGKMKDGTVKLYRKDDFLRYREKLEGKEVVMTLQERKKIRSTGKLDETGNQNGYYWAVIVAMISDAMGVTDGEAHQFLKWNFNRKGVDAKGKRWEIPGGTSSLTTAEFEEYCKKIRMWASDPETLNLYIPEPNEAVYE